MNHVSQSKSPSEIADELENLLISKASDLSNRIAELDRNIQRIEALEYWNEKNERSQALAKTRTWLSRVERLQLESRKTSGFAGLLTPIATFKHWRAVKDARRACTDAEAAFNAPDIKAERDARITTHNHSVHLEQTRLPGLNHQKDLLKSEKWTVDQFHNSANDAIFAARSNGWCARDFAQQFQYLADLAKNDQINQATAWLRTLIFQRRPSDTLYAKWQDEAVQLRVNAYHQYVGMAASGAYTKIAQHSIQLAAPMLRRQAATRLATFNHSADQWQALSSLLTNPQNLRTDALWAIYWAMYQCGQWIAKATAESDAHEDVLTGKVSAQIDRWLAGWAAERIHKLGYPEVRSYLGTLEIASTTEETRLGADIGLIVDLNVGDLICQKVALFQAKKSQSGMANVGSDSGQLSKLSRRPRTGYYLFYHQSSSLVMAPAPSVCSALELANQATLAGKDIDSARIPLNVREIGWDWANFVSFGLCDQNSEVGESFDTVEEALTALGNGNARHLPKYLHIITIADEPRVMELRAKIREHYYERAKTIEKKKGRQHSRDGHAPDHGMSR